MAEAAREFGDRLRSDGVAVFYFAGHGVQVKDRNYLIPVDADIQREDEVPYAAMDVGRIIDKMETARSRVNVVILDACRNNPFARSYRSAGQGLAQMDAPIGTLIAYATAPGKVALDNERKRNGIYTTHLLSHIRTPGLPIELMFKRVREGVLRETRGAQTPWESSSLRGEFTIVPSAGATAAAVPAAPPTGRSEAFEAELAFWDSIKSSSTRADYEAYLQQYPQGHFAALARARLGSLADAPAGAAAPSVDQPPPAARVAKTSPSRSEAATARRTDAAATSLLPARGDTWSYRMIDGFRAGVAAVLTYTVESASSDVVVEVLAVEGKRSFPALSIGRDAPFIERDGLDFGPPDFAPYLQAYVDLTPEARLPTARRRVRTFYQDVVIDVPLRVAQREKVTVPAGTFDAIRIAGTGSGSNRTDVRVTIWYAPAVKRYVKFDVASNTYHGANERLSFELVQFKVGH
jgi:uncharacterized caspase-like protein